MLPSKIPAASNNSALANDLTVLLQELKTSYRGVYSVGGINGGKHKLSIGNLCDQEALPGLTLVEGDRGTEIEAIEKAVLGV